MGDQPQRRRSNKFLIDYPLKDVTVGRRFGGAPRGEGRWQRIPHLGVLWTDDKQALQLGILKSQDNELANALRRRMVLMAVDGMTATVAFDVIASENRKYMIMHGDLGDRGEDNLWN